MFAHFAWIGCSCSSGVTVVPCPFTLLMRVLCFSICSSSAILQGLCVLYIFNLSYDCCSFTYCRSSIHMDSRKSTKHPRFVIVVIWMITNSILLCAAFELRLSAHCVCVRAQTRGSLYPFPFFQKVLVEAVESIKLMNPSSVTLRQNISSGPVVSHDEANSGVKSLDWFECPNCRVTSVQSHNIHYETLTSTELVVYEGTEKDELMQSNWKSTGKRPATHSSPSPVKTKKRANRRRRSDDQFFNFP